VKGWIGVRLDVASTDWIGLSILVEHGWSQVAPATVRQGRWEAKSPPPRRPPRSRKASTRQSPR
jgi:hypothetical protein